MKVRKGEFGRVDRKDYRGVPKLRVQVTPTASVGRLLTCLLTLYIGRAHTIELEVVVSLLNGFSSHTVQEQHNTMLQLGLEPPGPTATWPRRPHALVCPHYNIVKGGTTALTSSNCSKTAPAWSVKRPPHQQWVQPPADPPPETPYVTHTRHNTVTTDTETPTC
ncbi:hypothetical protein Pmani_020531 [Petrolisthes manimaculis]|uniref:Uncharacterized protein n=1 Tax=Petrolisthes manimaculis TaxID=1843537 RepID=A0AAE1PFI6_9EUCA|nr:hypothetical protein Pmani_020531 [Petrolisthes manimaculis]